jgi:hypothetical protein
MIEILSAHLWILRDPPLSGFPTDQRPSHRTCDDAAGGQKDRGGEDDPSTPLEMGDEDEDIDQEGKQREQQGWQE